MSFQQQTSAITIKVKGGIPPAPDLPLNSHNILIDGEHTNSTSTIPQPIETSKGKIQPVMGVVITASRRDEIFLMKASLKLHQWLF